MNLIIFGPQGSGKGTQARLIADKFNLFYFESGAFLREIAKNNTEVNALINKQGKMLPDKQMHKLATAYLDKNDSDRDNIIFDGFPRTTNQYELLKDWLSQKKKKIDKALLLDISEEETVRRLSARRTDKTTGKLYNLVSEPKPPIDLLPENLIQREDDKPAAIKTRLKLYHLNTQPLIEVFEKEGILIKVDGEQPIEVIFQEILSKL